MEKALYEQGNGSVYWGSMFDLKQFFGREEAPETHHDVTVAACALFIEMATIDDEFDEAELKHIVDLLESRYGVADEAAEELLTAAREELATGIDVWRYTNLINKNYSNDEKLEIVKLLWELVYADGHLSDHENYLMRKFGKMLRVSHKELINAKLMVLKDRRDA